MDNLIGSLGLVDPGFAISLLSPGETDISPILHTGQVLCSATHPCYNRLMMNSENTFYFPPGDPDLNYLAQAARIAVNTERSLRIAFDNGALKVKVGEGMWSPPMFGDDDPKFTPPVIDKPHLRLVD